MTGSYDDSGLGPPFVVEVAESVFAYVQPDGSWWINNTGFIVGERGVALLDTCSTERRTRDLLGAIAVRSQQPMRTLVNTHHHGDHTNGNSLLPGATIVAHRECRAEMSGARIGGLDAIFGHVEWGDLEPASPFVTFDDRLDLYVDDRLVELHYIGGPAHTTGDVFAWLPGDGVLFAGDLIFNGGTPFVVMGSVAGSLAAIATLRGFEPSTIVPGHGGVCDLAAVDAVERYLRFVQVTAASAKAAGLTPLEAARDVDLGEFSELLDSERIVGNLHRAYAELDGAAPGAPIDLAAAFGDMITYNGGAPLRCLA